MGWDEGHIGACRRHPDNKELPGVCSSCLRERLSKLYMGGHDKSKASFSGYCYSSSKSISPANSSCSSSKYMTMDHHLYRDTSDVMESMACMFSDGPRLTKSKSIAFVPTEGKKTRNRFWSKLLHIKGKKEKLDGTSEAGREMLI